MSNDRNSTTRNIQDWRDAVFELALLGFLLPMLISGCTYSSQTYQSPGIAEAQILNSSFQDALQESDLAFSELLGRQHKSKDMNLIAAVQPHFATASEISERYYSQLRLAYGTNSTRSLLLQHAGKINPSLTVVEAPNAFAKAFPGGQVVVSDALVMSLLGNGDKLSPALIGILLHELIHVRHGHAAQQWMTADGRVRFFQDEAASGLASLVSLVPGLSIKRTIGYWDTFELPNKLLSLSEYAADLGTILLLEQAGIDFKPYVSYLRSVQLQSRSTDSRQNLLYGRLKCIRESQGIEASNINVIVLGDVDLKTSKGASIERHEDPIGDLTSTDPLDVASARSFLHRACVIKYGLKDLSKVDGKVVSGPYFDTSMFTDFLDVFRRNRSDPKKS